MTAGTRADDCCPTDPGSGEQPTLEMCPKTAKTGLHMYWDCKPASHLFFKR